MSYDTWKTTEPEELQPGTQWQTCPECKGEGFVDNDEHPDGYRIVRGKSVAIKVCERCHGQGEVAK